MVSNFDLTIMDFFLLHSMYGNAYRVIVENPKTCGRVNKYDAAS